MKLIAFDPERALGEQLLEMNRPMVVALNMMDEPG